MAYSKSNGVIADWFQNRYEDIDGGLIEVRVMTDGKVVHREWCSTPQAIEKIVEAYPKESVFYGLAPRKKRGAGKKPDVTCVPFLWADVDVNKLGWDMTKAMHAIHGLPDNLRPTAMVHSGGGLHLYWQLDKPWKLLGSADTVIWQACVAAVEGLNKKLAGLVHGDTVFDITRVLRVPGSFNPKKGTKKRVEVIYDYRWHKHDFKTLEKFATDAKQTLMEDQFVAMKDVPKASDAKLSYEEAFMQALGVGNKAARRIRLDALEDRARYGGTGFPYIGIDEFITRAVSMLHIDHEDNDETVIDLVFDRVENIMQRADPAEWSTWDHEAEKAKIRTNLERYKPKWLLTKARMKAEAKAQAKKARAEAASSKTSSKGSSTPSS